MTPHIHPLVAGNWKMNGTAVSLDQLSAIGEGFADAAEEKVAALICVPATLLSKAADVLAHSSVACGGQDCHTEANGAHTGDVAAEMLQDCGASHVIVGHSERRTDHGETDAQVAAKAKAAWRAGLVAIICVGETQAERDAGNALSVLSRQIAGSVPENATAESTVIAYEPVWAIGTGLTPTLDDIAAMHVHIRTELRKSSGDQAARIRILYGGSVKPANAADILAIANVDGALVGGASLKAADFLAIAAAYRAL